MTRQSIFSGIQSVAKEHLNWDGDLTEKSLLVEKLRLDSIRLLTLVAEVENHFEICLEEGDEQRLNTIGDLIDLILERTE